MMSKKLNNLFIDMLGNNMPGDVNPAVLIADTLNIGREAAYRRLRGEVLFSFGEAAQLALRLNFSLDRARGTVEAGNIMFQMQFNDFYSTLEKYNEILEKDICFFKQIGPESDTVYAVAGSAIPAEYYMRHELMAKFKYFKWLYQHGLSDPNVRTFEQMQVPAALVANHKEYIRAMQEVKISWYVLDNDGFKHWIMALRAFRDMQLISEKSMLALKNELLQLLDELEQIAVVGSYANGNKVYFYLSDIDLESTYSYLLTPSYKGSGIGVFSLNALRTTDPVMFDQIKRWVQTQTRFSTLISCSGELQRIHYFKRQREIVSALEREGMLPSPEASRD